MKIVHVGDFKIDSAVGVHRTIWSIIKYMNNSNFMTEIWDFTYKDRNINSLNILKDVKVVRLPKYKNRFLTLFFFPKKTRQYIASQLPTISLFHFHSVFIPEHIHLSFFSIPYIITPNGGLDDWRTIKSKYKILKRIWNVFIGKKYINNAKFIHCVSEYEKNQMETQYQANCFLAYNGVDGELIRKKFNKDSKRDYILYLGRFDFTTKGLDLLLQGYAISRKMNTSYLPKLLIVGPDYRYGKNKILNLINILGLSECVEVKSEIFGEEKEELLYHAKFLILTSRSEGLPFTVIEALALGKPVIVTNETHLADHILRYQCGLITSLNPLKIAVSILELNKKTENEFYTYANNSRKCVETEFNNYLNTQIIFSHYRKVGCSGS